ncbi:MAG: aldo/keto reductase [Candidatus Kariarchaeaceae archaeon]|jgi:diketogulonate reductase-like aldo/keto reductase
MEYLTLNSGQKIPQLGFGTADIGSYKFTQEVIGKAIAAGFTRFDTASMYGNEKAIGDSLTEKQKNELIIATKLWAGGDFRYSTTMKEIDNSMKKLGVEVLDIYLQHWPVSGQRLDAWKAMEERYNSGEIRGIGVSNFTIDHLEELMAEREIAPVLNQVEFNPFLFQKELMEYCKEHDIVLEAYSPFAKGRKLSHPVLQEIAQTHEKSTAQVVLRWGIQLGISIIPKASKSENIEQNIDIFDFSLSNAEMNEIGELNEDYRIEWDPTDEV